MSASAYLASLRRIAEARMESRCAITRTQLVTLDTASLNLTDDDPDDDLIYAGPCRVSSTSSAVLTTDAEGQLLASQQLILHVPIAAAGVKAGDAVRITDGGPDPELTGRDFTILGLPAVSLATARRFPVEQALTEDR